MENGVRPCSSVGAGGPLTLETGVGLAGFNASCCNQLLKVSHS